MATIDLLSRTTTFSKFDRERLNELASAAVVTSVKRGEILWRAGDVLPSLVVMQKGLVKLVRNTSRGRAICGLLGPGEVIDDIAVVRGVPCATDAVAASDAVSIVSVPRHEVMRAFERDPRMFLALACSVEQKVETLFDKIDVLSAGSVEARLATLLLKLNDRFGDDFDDDTSEIPVALSRRDLAELVATSFETAIRIMSRWEREGVLETTRRGFTVRDMNRLGSLSGSPTALAAE
jgi:CRP-like cAMP-binding protein